MSTLTAEAIQRIVGPVDRPTTAALLATGASEAELLEAFAWLNADDAMMDEGRPLPRGRVGELIEILQPADDDPAA